MCLDQASVHVDTGADVPQLVRAALELSRADAQLTAAATRDTVDNGAMTKLATQALVQLGYPRPVARSVVNAASVHVDDGDLATLIKEALRRTSS
jgi:Holliday junction resolvasome RuvABC DNA-binding subunit